MTKEKALMICEQINTSSINSYKPTSVKACVEKKSNDYEVIVSPSDDNDNPLCFHHVDYFGVLVSGYGVRSYLSFESDVFEGSCFRLIIF